MEAVQEHKIESFSQFSQMSCSEKVITGHLEKLDILSKSYR
jgi:hypothetical protein